MLTEQKVYEHFKSAFNIVLKHKKNCLVFDVNKQISSAIRNIYYDDAEHKFFEFIDFNNGYKKRAILIGINPKEIEEKTTDYTNKQITTWLIKNNYAGYILLNLYTKRTEHSGYLLKYLNSMIGQKDNVNCCMNVLSDIINDTDCDEEILLFWGSDYLRKANVFSSSLNTALNNKYSQCKYSSGKKGAFVHPSKKYNKVSAFVGFVDLINNKTYWK